MVRLTFLILVNTVALLTFTLVAAKDSKPGISCNLKSSKVVSSQRMCVYLCSDKTLEGRFTNVDSNCTIRINSDS